MATTKFEQDHDVKHFWIFPYRWNLRLIFKNLWNPDDPRILPPKQFGVGWNVNFHALLTKIRRR